MSASTQDAAEPATTAPPIAHVADLAESGSLGVRLPDGRDALLVRVHGRVSAFENRCPHQGVPLEAEPNRFLEAGGELIQCAMHGALFLPEGGECVFGPCQGEHLCQIPVSVDDDGRIHLAGE
ncbi:Rieske (2Fe-2S) protein [Halomonas saccharevitans]|uniref:Ferredoxin subunit of nitrite reductase or a ring-hydroxylating dioxygenase n=1 Tax=Halomonas saccharevitans TaxID=416872 RepID=A0A1I7CMZ3_9GAMM|nr:Rieske 2Fe-2S domain-containing protein [Halomonas saccharevitans]SFU00773.1 Ferredoxin subunit of nitrite reductase or a ring-hydroxylating dioxygenase [Halomonas saccharevitans]